MNEHISDEQSNKSRTNIHKNRNSDIIDQNYQAQTMMNVGRAKRNSKAPLSRAAQKHSSSNKPSGSAPPSESYDDTTLSMSTPASDLDDLRHSDDHNHDGVSFSSSDGSSYYSDVDMNEKVEEVNLHEDVGTPSSKKYSTDIQNQKKSEKAHGRTSSQSLSREKKNAVHDQHQEEVYDSTARLAQVLEDLSDSLRSERKTTMGGLNDSEPEKLHQTAATKRSTKNFPGPFSKTNPNMKNAKKTTPKELKSLIMSSSVPSPPAPFPNAQPLMDMVDCYFEVDVATTNSGVSRTNLLSSEDTKGVFYRRIIPLEVDTSHNKTNDYDRKNLDSVDVHADDDISAVSETVDGSAIGSNSFADDGSSEIAVHIHMEQLKNVDVQNGMDDIDSDFNQREDLISLFSNGIRVTRQETLSTLMSLSSWEDNLEDGDFSEADNSNDAVKAPRNKIKAEGAIETDLHDETPLEDTKITISPIPENRTCIDTRLLSHEADDVTGDLTVDKRIEQLKEKIRKMKKSSQFSDMPQNSSYHTEATVTITSRPSTQSTQGDSGNTSSLSVSLGDETSKQSSIVQKSARAQPQLEPARVARVQTKSSQPRPKRSELLQVPEEIPLTAMEEISVIDCDIKPTGGAHTNLEEMKRNRSSYDVEEADLEEVEIESLTPKRHEKDAKFEQAKKQFNDLLSKFREHVGNGMEVGQRSINQATTIVSERCQGMVVNIQQRSVKDQILLATIAVGSFVLFVLLIMVIAK